MTTNPSSLHGGPGAQEPNQPFTGQYNPNADFYNDYNYGRAVEWLRWMTEVIHTTDEFSNAGMLEVINEPVQGDGAVDSLRSQYYVDAYNVSATTFLRKYSSHRDLGHPRGRV